MQERETSLLINLPPSRKHPEWESRKANKQLPQRDTGITDCFIFPQSKTYLPTFRLSVARSASKVQSRVPPAARPAGMHPVSSLAASNAKFCSKESRVQLLSPRVHGSI